MVAVMALVSEPRWNRSSRVTGIASPHRRVPTAPTAITCPSCTTAAARAGISYAARYGWSSRFSDSCAGANHPARANVRMTTTIRI